MPSTTSDCALPERIEVPLGDGGHRELTYVGPGANGLIYDGGDGRYYRLLPIRAASPGRAERRSDDSPIERRTQIEEQVGRKPPAGRLAPIRRAETIRLHERELFVVEYRLDGSRPLLDQLREAGPLERLTHVFNALPCLEQWWQGLYHGLAPMPAELVLDTSHQVHLLWLPEWRPPDLESVLDQPARGAYLSPDYVRGLDDPGLLRNLDVYAFGHLLFENLYRVEPTADGTMILRSKMTGTLPEAGKRVPFWFDWLPELGEVERGIRRMLAPDPVIRSAVDLISLYAGFQEVRSRLNLEGVVGRLRGKHGAKVAFLYLHRILMSEHDYDLYLRGARLCGWQLDLPVHAIDLCEAAIALDADRPDAYRLQFQLIAAEQARPALEELIAGNPKGGTWIDAQMHRNHSRLQGFAGNEEDQMRWCRFLLWRHPQTAMLYSYDRLRDHDQNGRWSFWWRLLYAEALIAVDQPEMSRTELDRIQQDFTRAHQAAILPAELLRAQGETFNQLDARWRRRFRRPAAR